MCLKAVGSVNNEMLKEKLELHSLYMFFHICACRINKGIRNGKLENQAWEVMSFVLHMQHV